VNKRGVWKFDASNILEKVMLEPIEEDEKN
jgi:hypothetical protein